MANQIENQKIAAIGAYFVFSDFGFMRDAMDDGIETEEQLQGIILENPSGIDQTYDFLAMWENYELQDYLDYEQWSDDEQNYFWSKIEESRKKNS